MLDILNDQGEVIGQATRERAHREGLLIRFIYVWFYNPKGIILQRRGYNKDSWPGRLTTAVSGHVSAGLEFIDAAIVETLEESGIKITPEDLVDLGTVHLEYSDPSINYTTNALRRSYAYKYEGDLGDLIIEEGEGAGFEMWSFERLLEATKSQPNEFVTFLTSDTSREIIQKIAKL